ncbi:MAG: type 4a pilus biogenesis protein PilO [Chitinivibrionales bacterium]|nr:type 4a pilus biogenesis protein PilO [Chitinivibrionales bacterium]
MNAPKLDFKNPRVRNPLIIIALGLACTGAWYYWIYQEKAQVRREKFEDLRTKENKLNAILAMKPQLTKLKKDIEQDNADLDSLKNIFPDQEEIPKLIREITRVGRASGILTRKFTPLPDVQKEYYIENRYTMEIMGGFHQIADFFARLANLELLINLSDVKLNSNPELAKLKEQMSFEGQSVPSLVASFKLTTFSSKK